MCSCFFHLLDLVLATAGEDSKISLWRKNGQSLWTVPANNARGEIVEVHYLDENHFLFVDFPCFIIYNCNAIPCA